VLLVPDKALPYLLLQRTDYLLLPRMKLLFRAICRLSSRTPLMTAVTVESRLRKRAIKRRFDADIQREYESLRDWLPKYARAVLDVGCGIGGIDVMLYHHYDCSQDLRFYLLDRTQQDEQIDYGYRERADFYNSFDVTRELVVRSGVPERSLVMLEAREDAGIDLAESVDLVVSLISWGFHYPVATYLDRTHELLRPGGRLILDVRKDTGGVEEIAAKYGNATVITNEKKRQRVVATR
jgi:SAM-dependent methyltransferase